MSASARLRPSTLLAASSALLVAGCLVGDPRPEPGRLITTASSDQPLREGFTSGDGWSIEYARFLASLGHVSPEGDSCTFYSDAAYNRVLDMRREGSQRLSLLFALGACQLDYEVSSPWSDSVLGVGVTPADRDFMRTPASDDEVTEAGVSIYVEGRAVRDNATKRFAWAFRKRIDSSNCYSFEDDERVYGVEFRGGTTAFRELVVHGDVLFHTRRNAADAPTVFDPFARADDLVGDGDGEVTLNELGQVSLTEIQGEREYQDADANWKTLEDYVYRGLFTEIVRYQGDGRCNELEIFPNDRTPR